MLPDLSFALDFIIWVPNDNCGGGIRGWPTRAVTGGSQTPRKRVRVHSGRDIRAEEPSESGLVRKQVVLRQQQRRLEVLGSLGRP